MNARTRWSRIDRAGVVALLTLAACAGDDGGTSAGSTTGGGSTSAGSSGTEGASSTSAGTSAGTGDATSAGTTSGGTSAGTSSGTTGATETGGSGTTAGEVCAPAEAVAAAFLLDPEPVGDVDDAACVVTSIVAEGDAWVGGLACGDQIYALTITATPALAPELAVDAMVRLDYRRDDVFWVNRWVALRSGDGFRTLVGGVSSSALDPPGTTIGEFFVDPTLVEVDGVCAPAAATCGDEERLAIEMSLGEYPTLVLDHSSAYADILAYAIHIVVESARRSIRMTCDDYPEAWYQLVFVWSSSD